MTAGLLVACVCVCVLIAAAEVCRVLFYVSLFFSHFRWLHADTHMTNL